MNDFKKKLIEKLPELKSHAMILSIKHLKNSEKDEDDLLQETLKKAIINQHTFDGKNFLAWLKKIMRNIAIDEFRHESIKIEVKGENGTETKRKSRKINYGQESTYSDEDGKDKGPSFENNPEIDITSERSKNWGDSTTPEKEKEDERERKNMLFIAINKLPKKCKEIIRLFADGFSYLEMSEKLGTPLSATTTNLSRCRKRLDKIVKELFGEFNEV